VNGCRDRRRCIVARATGATRSRHPPRGPVHALLAPAEAQPARHRLRAVAAHGISNDGARGLCRSIMRRAALQPPAPLPLRWASPAEKRHRFGFRRNEAGAAPDGDASNKAQAACQSRGFAVFSIAPQHGSTGLPSVVVGRKPSDWRLILRNPAGSRRGHRGQFRCRRASSPRARSRSARAGLGLQGAPACPCCCTRAWAHQLGAISRLFAVTSKHPRSCSGSAARQGRRAACSPARSASFPGGLPPMRSLR